MKIWVSYSGKDSGSLVEALDKVLRGSTDHELSYYTKQANAIERGLTKLEPENAGIVDELGADVEYPVDIPEAASGYYLRSNERLKELVFEIGFSQPNIVILSPEYFNSAICLAELGAVASLNVARRVTRDQTLFVLKDLVREQLKPGTDSTVACKTGDVETRDLGAAVVQALRRVGPSFEALDCTEVTEEKMNDFLLDLSGKILCAVTGNPADLVAEISRRFSYDESAVFHQEGTRKLIDGFAQWFTEKPFGPALMNHLKEAEKLDERSICTRLLTDPVALQRELKLGLDTMSLSSEIKMHDSRWNESLATLAGFVGMSICDQNTLQAIGENVGELPVWFVSFDSKYKLALRASLLSARVGGSRILLHPCSSTRKRPQDTSYHLGTGHSAVSNEPANGVTRDLVRTLHRFAHQEELQKLSDDEHPTGLNDEDRIDLVSAVRNMLRTLGWNSLVLTVHRDTVAGNLNWWAEDWQRMLEKVNEGSEIGLVLRAVVVSTAGQGCEIRFSPDWNDRLMLIETLLGYYRWN